MDDPFPKTLTKEASETRRYDMDFASRLLEGEVLVSLDSYEAATEAEGENAPETVEDLTVEATLALPDASAADQKKVQFNVSGGSADVLYQIKANVTGSLGTVAEGVGFLYVYEN
jgi:hypothetical protein